MRYVNICRLLVKLKFIIYIYMKKNTNKLSSKQVTQLISNPEDAERFLDAARQSLKEAERTPADILMDEVFSRQSETQGSTEDGQTQKAQLYTERVKKVAPQLKRKIEDYWS